MSKAILDASAVLAMILGEPGADALQPTTAGDFVVSAVNLAEVQSKLVRSGMNADAAWTAALAAVGRIAEFTAGQARIAGSLVAVTRPLGLSLGDRACLALGMEMQAPIYTTDRSWVRLRLGVQIHCLR